MEGNGAELGACAECTTICSLLHWHKSDLYPSVSRFFKVLIGLDWNRVLLVPPTFAANVADLVGKKTELENANGEKWTVKLSSFHQGFGFQMGWQEFVSDHNLTMGDFLVFNYIKGSRFIVQIFGRSGCEKNCEGSFRRNRCKENVFVRAKPCEKKSMDTVKRFGLSTPVVPGNKSKPSAKYRAQDSGGDNIRSPFLDSDTGYFEVHKSKKSIELGVGTSSLGHTGMRLQAEANKDFGGTENFKSNIFSKFTDVIMTEKDNAMEFRGDRTHKQGDDWSSPYANEGAVFKNSGQEYTGAGELTKMLKKEEQERTERVHGHALMTRDLESSPPPLTITYCKQVKPDPLALPSSSDAVTCLAVTEGQHLDLPSRLPGFRFRRGRMETKAVVLVDQKLIPWPALYQEGSGSHVLICDWEGFNQKNGVQAGEKYAFRNEGAIAAHQFTYKVDIIRKE